MSEEEESELFSHGSASPVFGPGIFLQQKCGKGKEEEERDDDNLVVDELQPGCSQSAMDTSEVDTGGSNHSQEIILDFRRVSNGRCLQKANFIHDQIQKTYDTLCTRYSHQTDFSSSSGLTDFPTIFGLKYTDSDFLRKPMKWFCAFRFHLSDVYNSLNGHSSMDESAAAQITRDVNLFCDLALQSIKRVVKRESRTIPEEQVSSFVGLFLTELKDTLLEIGLFSDVQSSSQNCLSTHYFHQCLRLWCFALESAVILEQGCTSSPQLALISLATSVDGIIIPQKLSSHLVLIILYDFISYFITNKGMVGSSLSIASLFPCGCAQRLCLLVQVVCENHLRQSFWASLTALVSPALNPMLESNATYNSDLFYVSSVTLREKLPNLLMCDVVRLMSQCMARSETFASQGPTKLLDKILAAIISEFASNSGSSATALELQLRHFIDCALELTHNDSLVLRLWDFYLARLNNPSPGGDTPAGQLEQDPHCLTESLERWHDAIVSYTMPDKDQSWTSWQRFLQYFALSCKDDNVWQKIKGRIYVKIKPTAIKECNSVGINNLLSIFLLLAYIRDPNDVSQQFKKHIMNKLQLNFTTSDSVRKCRVMCRAAALFITFFGNHKLDASSWCDFLTKTLGGAIHVLCSPQRADRLLAEEAESLISDYYCTVVTHLTCNSELPLVGGTHALLAVQMDRLLSNDCLDANSQSAIIGALSGVFKSLRRRLSAPAVPDAQIAPFVHALKQTVVISLRKNWPALFKIHQFPVVELMGDMLLMLSQAPQSYSLPFDELKIIFWNVLLGLRLERFALTFVHRCCLEDSRFLDCLDTEKEDTVGALWFETIMRGDGDAVQLQWLGKRVVELRCLATLVPGIREHVHLIENGRNVEFCSALFKEFGESRNEVLVKRLISAWFGRIVDLTHKHKSAASNEMRKAELPLRILGAFVRHCSGLIFKLGNSTCLMPQILNKIIASGEITESNSAFHNAVAKFSLCDVMEGVLCLDWQNQKQRFLQRKIHETFLYYIPLLCRSEKQLLGWSHFERNPLYRILKSTCAPVPNHDRLELRCILLQAIDQGFKAKTHNNRAAYMAFYEQILEKTDSRVALEKDVEKASIFVTSFLNTEEPMCFEVVCKLIHKLQFHDQNIDLSFVSTPIAKNFGSSNGNRCSDLVKKLKEKIPTLTAQLDQKLKRSVEIIEKTNGQGINSELRANLNKCMQKTNY